MITLKNTTDTAIKVFIFMLSCLPGKQLSAQAIDFSKMTPDERKAAQSKIEAASRVDWQNMMNLLGLKTPVLGPQMEDSTRLPNLGELAFREHIGGHSDLPDWPIFINFAARYFDKK